MNKGLKKEKKKKTLLISIQFMSGQDLMYPTQYKKNENKMTIKHMKKKKQKLNSILIYFF